MQAFFAKITPLLAEAPSDSLGLPVGAAGGAHSFRAVDILVVIVAILLVMTLLICWAIFIRKPRNEQTRTRIYKSHSHAEEELDDGTVRKRKRHKTPRRSHRTRNPTLAEAGGLPPVRPSDSPRSDL